MKVVESDRASDECTPVGHGFVDMFVMVLFRGALSTPFRLVAPPAASPIADNCTNCRRVSLTSCSDFDFILQSEADPIRRRESGPSSAYRRMIQSNTVRMSGVPYRHHSFMRCFFPSSTSTGWPAPPSSASEISRSGRLGTRGITCWC